MGRFNGHGAPPVAAIICRVAAPTLLFEIRDRWMLVVHGSEAPSDREWNVYVDALRNLDERGDGLGAIIFSDGGGPTALQRRMIAGIRMHSAVIASSKVVQGMVTALKWMGARMEGYPPSGIRKAFHDLGVEPAVVIPIMERLATMRLALCGRRGVAPSRADLQEFFDRSLP